MDNIFGYYDQNNYCSFKDMDLSWSDFTPSLRESIITATTHVLPIINDHYFFDNVLMNLRIMKIKLPASSPEPLPLVKVIFDTILQKKDLIMNTPGILSRRESRCITSPVYFLSMTGFQWKDVPENVKVLIRECVAKAAPSLIPKDIYMLKDRYKDT